MADSVVPDCLQGGGDDGGEGELEGLTDFNLQQEDVLLGDVGAGLLDAGM